MSGRTDMERLEWMSKAVSSVSQRANEDNLWKLFFFTSVAPKAFDVIEMDEFRAAIDAAMDAEERG